jgi:phage terminase small subunit
MDERAARTGITADRVLEEYAAIAFSDITDAIEFNGSESKLKDSNNLSKSVTCAIKSVSTSISNNEKGEVRKTSIAMHDKLRALEMLARHTGIASDFNHCVAGLRRFGINVGIDNNGKPYLIEVDESEEEMLAIA